MAEGRIERPRRARWWNQPFGANHHRPPKIPPCLAHLTLPPHPLLDRHGGRKRLAERQCSPVRSFSSRRRRAFGALFSSTVREAIWTAKKRAGLACRRRKRADEARRASMAHTHGKGCSCWCYDTLEIFRILIDFVLQSHPQASVRSAASFSIGYVRTRRQYPSSIGYGSSRDARVANKGESCQPPPGRRRRRCPRSRSRRSSSRRVMLMVKGQTSPSRPRP